MVKQASYTVFRLVCAVFVAVVLAGCSVSKFIPEGRYMLDDVEIKSDVKGIETSQFEPYVRQKGNSKWFSLFKIPLGTYALAGRDTTKWLNRKLKAMGEKRVAWPGICQRQR